MAVKAVKGDAYEDISLFKLPDRSDDHVPAGAYYSEIFHEALKVPGVGQFLFESPTDARKHVRGVPYLPGSAPVRWALRRMSKSLVSSVRRSVLARFKRNPIGCLLLSLPALGAAYVIHVTTEALEATTVGHVLACYLKVDNEVTCKRPPPPPPKREAAHRK
jgi:hypothetical protein